MNIKSFTKSISINHLSKNDTLILKGISILLIGFHNFLHWVPPHLQENEFSFNQSLAFSWLNYLSHNIQDIFLASMSFFGHYGVSAFILISGYGLSLSYKNKALDFIPFIIKRLRKIYPALFLAALIWLFVQSYENIHFLYRTDTWVELAHRLFLIPGIEDNRLFMIYGPWWFFSLIVQLYLLFPFIMWLLKRNLKMVILSVCLILLILPQFFNPSMAYYASAIFQLPIFALGAYLGFQEKIKLPPSIVPIALLMFMIGQVNPIFWKISHLLAGLLIFCFVLWLRKRTWKVNGLFSFFGIISFHFFVIHPFVRSIFIDLNKQIDLPQLLSIIYVAVSAFSAVLFKSVDHTFVDMLEKIKNSINLGSVKRRLN